MKAKKIPDKDRLKKLLNELSAKEIDQVGKIFNKAKEDSLGYEPYAKQIAEIYKNKHR